MHLNPSCSDILLGTFETPSKIISPTFFILFQLILTSFPSLLVCYIIVIMPRLLRLLDEGAERYDKESEGTGSNGKGVYMNRERGNWVTEQSGRDLLSPGAFSLC